MENIFSQMGLGVKQISDRYSEYTAPAHDPHILYSYEPSTPTSHHITHVAKSKHSYGGGGLKSGASMSALTLLAFLFFLHILQQCIKDHMAEMATPPVVVMTAGREGEDGITKSVANKIDKGGIDRIDPDETEVDDAGTAYEKYNAKNPYDQKPEDGRLMKINSAEYKPKPGDNKIKYVYKNRSAYNGYINAMDDNIEK